MAAVLSVLSVACLIGLYFMPALAAFYRQHPQRTAILLLNLCLGWTVLGWLAAGFWAASLSNDPSL